MKYKIGAVITTYNPDIDRLKSVINSIYNQVFIIIIVDNNSNNYNKIYEIFKISKIITAVNPFTVNISHIKI